ncbi:hypothetical protein BD311DRAFT_214910 [Dichomitus squalens]|nr:hypothetical protein BD311DRAFT_214910 [Dichomitus squalens]
MARGTCLSKITYLTVMTLSPDPISVCHRVHRQLDFVLLPSPPCACPLHGTYWPSTSGCQLMSEPHYAGVFRLL